MTQQEQPDESIGGLARRWLKTQLRFHGDPIKSRRDQQEAQAIEQRMHDKAHDDAANAVVTALMSDSWKRKISSLERANEEGRVARDAQQQAEHEARPRVSCSLSLGGDISGSGETEIPLLVHPPSQPGDPMTVFLEPLEPIQIGGHNFLGIQFAVPEYSGPGTYDPNTIEARLRLESWDPLWFQLSLDTTDEGFDWSPDNGRGTINVTDTSIHVHLPMSNGNGTDVLVNVRVQLTAPARSREPNANGEAPEA